MTAMTSTKRVLVIDDDPVIGRSFDRVLTPKGYAVIAASDGAAALERLAREDYDVVYTDLKMPGMNGMEVARRIKASRPWLPVVIVTGYGTDANEAEARGLGVAAFLRKPLSPETIEASASSTHAVPAAPAEVASPAPLASPRARSVARTLKDVGLFLAAPFIGLAFLVVGPFFGLGVLGYTACRALRERLRRSA